MLDLLKNLIFYKSNAINILISALLITLLFTPIISFNIFNAIKTNKQNLFIMGSDGIYLFDKEPKQIKKLQEISDTLQAYTHFGATFLDKFDGDEGFILCRARTNIYLYLEDQLICNSTLNETFQSTIIDLALDKYEKISETNYTFHYVISYF